MGLYSEQQKYIFKGHYICFDVLFQMQSICISEYRVLLFLCTFAVLEMGKDHLSPSPAVSSSFPALSSTILSWILKQLRCLLLPTAIWRLIPILWHQLLQESHAIQWNISNKIGLKICLRQVSIEENSSLFSQHKVKQSSIHDELSGYSKSIFKSKIEEVAPL